MSDRVFSVVALIACAALAWVGWQIEAPFSYEPIGPKAYPLLLLGLMAACAVWLFIKPDARADWPEDKHLRFKVVALLGVVFAWSLLFQPIGFIASTILASIAIGWLFDATWKGNVISAIVSGVGLYLFFDKLLDVNLPLGRLWGF